MRGADRHDGGNGQRAGDGSAAQQVTSALTRRVDRGSHRRQQQPGLLQHAQGQQNGLLGDRFGKLETGQPSEVEDGVVATAPSPDGRRERIELVNVVGSLVVHQKIGTRGVHD